MRGAPKPMSPEELRDLGIQVTSMSLPRDDPRSSGIFWGNRQYFRRKTPRQLTLVANMSADKKYYDSLRHLKIEEKQLKIQTKEKPATCWEKTCEICAKLR